MSSVDERVVEMRFDNAQFEKGVSKTLSSLDKLKEGLQFSNAINGFDAIETKLNGLKLNGINKSLDELNSRFTAIGIAGQALVTRLTNSAIDAVKKVTTAIPNQIKQGGWNRALNIENAKFQLTGLKVAWDDVSNDLSYAVNQTAYGLDSAAKAAAQLSASGVQAGGAAITAAKDVDKFSESLLDAMGGQSDSATARATGQLDDMAIALRSISGVAAMTNTSYDEIANVFIRIAGQGKVMATDLNSLAARGLNAAATLGEAMGMTEAEVRDAVHDGKIDFQTFSDAMYDAFADHAVEANNTFQGALSNTKAALSKIGAEVADDILPASTKVLNAIRLLINAIKTSIMPILNSLGKLIISTGNVIAGIFDKIRGKLVNATNAGKQVLKPIQKIQQWIDKLRQKVEDFGVSIGVIQRPVEKTTQALEKTSAVVGKTAEEVQALANAVIHGDYGNGAERVQKLGDAFAQVQNRVNEMLGSSKRYEVNTISAEEAAAQAAAEAERQAAEAAAEAERQLKAQTITDILAGIGNIGKTVKFVFTQLADAIGQVFKGIKTLDVATGAKNFKEFTGRIINSQEAMEKLSDTIFSIVYSIANIFKAVGKVVVTVGKAIFETISEIEGFDVAGVAHGFRDFTSSLVMTDEAADGLKEILKAILSPLKLIVPLVSTGAKAVLKLGTAIGTALKKFLEFVGKSKVLKSLNDVFVQLLHNVREFFDGFIHSEGFQNFVKDAKALAGTIGRKLTELFERIADKLAKANRKAKSLNGTTGESISLAKRAGQTFGKVFDALGNGLSFIDNILKGNVDFAGMFSKLFKGIVSGATGLGGKIGSALKGLVDKINLPDFLKKIFGSIGDKLGGVFGPLVNSFKKTITGASNEVASAANKAAGGLNQAAQQPKGLIGIFKSLVDGIKADIAQIDFKGAAEAVKNGFVKFVQLLYKALTAVDWNALIHGALSAVLLMGIIRNVFKQAKVIDSAKGMLDSIGGMFKTISAKIAGNIPKKSKLRDLAESLAIITGCIAGLAILSKYTNVPQGIAMLSIVLGELIGAYVLLGVLDKKGKIGDKAIQSFSASALKLTAGIGLLSLCISKLAKMKWGDFGSGMGKLVILIGSMYAMITFMNRFSKLDIKGGKFIAIAVAINMLLIPLSILAAIPFGFYMKGLSKMVLLLVALGGTVALMNWLSGDADAVKAAPLLAMAVDIGAITGALILISLIPFNKVLKSVLALSAVLIVISKTMMNNMATTEDSKVYNQMATALIKMAVSMVIMALIPWKGILKGVVGLSSVLIAMGVSLKIAKGFAGDEGMGKTLKSLAADILAMTVSLLVLSNIPWQGLLKSAIALSGVMIALGGAVRLAGSGDIKGKSMAAFIAGIAAITAAMFVLTKVKDTNALIKVAGALSGTMIALAAALNIAQKSSEKINFKNILKMFVALAAITAAMYVLQLGPDPNSLASVGAGLALALTGFVGAIAILAASNKYFGARRINTKNILKMIVALGAITAAMAVLSNAAPDGDTLIASAEAISSTLVAFAVAMMVVSQYAGNKIDMKSILSMVVGLGAVTAALAVLANTCPDPNALIPIATGIGIALVALSGSMVIASQAQGKVDIKNVLAILPALAAVAIVLGILGQIQNPEGLIPIATAISEVLIVLAGVTAIAALIGKTADPVSAAKFALAMGAILVIVFAAVLAIGGIMQLIDALAGEDAAMKTLQKAVDGMKKVGEMFGSVIAGFFDPFVDLLGRIASLPDGMKEKVDAFAELLAALGAATLVEGLFGLANLLTGFTVFEKTGKDITKGIEKLDGAIDAINEMNITDETSRKSKTLADLVRSMTGATIQTSGGLFGWLGSLFTGKKSLTGTANDMKKSIKKLTAYVEAVSGLDEGQVNLAKNNTKSIANMMKTLNSTKLRGTSGIADFFMGFKSLEDTATDMAKAAASLNTYVLSVAFFKTDTVTRARDNTKLIAEMMRSLGGSAGTYGGVADFFTGVSSIAATASDMGLALPGLGAYVLAVSAMSEDNLAGAKTKTQYLADMMSILQGSAGTYGGVGSFFTGISSITATATDLGLALPGLAAYVTGVGLMNADDLADAKTKTEYLAYMMSALVKANEGNDYGGIASFFTGISSITATADDMNTSVPSLKAYVDQVNEMTEEDLASASTNTGYLAEMMKTINADDLKEDNPFVNFINGLNGITTTAEDIKTFGERMGEFVDQVNGIDGIVTAKDRVEKLIEIMGKFTSDYEGSPFKEGALNSAITMASGGDTFTKLGTVVDDMDLLGQNITQCQPVDTTNYDAVVQAVQDMGIVAKNSIDPATTSSFNLFATAVGTLATSLGTTINTFDQGKFDEFKGAINSFCTTVDSAQVDATTTSFQNLKTAMTDASTTATDTAKQLSEDVGKALEQDSGYSYNSGMHLVDNFANGMTANKQKAINAASDLAGSMSDYLHHSTPKKGKLKDDNVWGKHLVENIASGITKYAKKAGGAAEGLAGKIANGFKSKTGTSLSGVAKQMGKYGQQLLSGQGNFLGASSIMNEDYWNNNLSGLKDYCSSSLGENEDLNSKLFDAASSMYEGRKTQMGNSLTDGANYWSSVASMTQEGTDANENAIEQYNQAILSDTKNLVELRKRTYGSGIEDERAIWLQSYNQAKTSGKATYDTLQQLQDGYNDAAISGIQNMIANRKRAWGQLYEREVDIWARLRDEVTKTGLATVDTIQKINDQMQTAMDNDIQKKIDDDTRKYGKAAVSTMSIYRDAAKDAQKYGLSAEYINGLNQKAASGYVTDVQNWFNEINKHGNMTKTQIQEWWLQRNMNAPTDLSYDEREDLNEKWYQAREDTEAEELDAAKETLDTIKQYRDISEYDEAVYWQNIVKTTRAGSTAQKNAQKNYYEAVETLREKYAQNVKSDAESLKSSLGNVFTSEFKFDDIDRGGKSILQNAKAQVDAVEKFSSAYEEIASRNILTKDTLEDLYNLGAASGTPVLEELLGYSDADLQKFEDYMAEIKSASKSAAETKNEELKSQLDKLMVEPLTQSVQDTVSKALEITTGTPGSDEWISNMQKNVKKLVNSGDSEAKGHYTQFLDTGGNLMSGMITGIVNQSPAVVNAVRSAVAAAIEAARQEADIHSPSRVMKGLGSYMGEGLAIGIENWVDPMKNVGKDLASAAIDSVSIVSSAMDAIDDDDLEFKPTITPVIDTSMAENGAAEIGSMFGNDYAQAVQADISYQKMNQAAATAGNTTNNSVGAINVNIYPTSNQNANDISDAVIKRINNELTRRGRVYR